MTLGDITIAPFMDRMCVLEEYRKFVVPKEEKYEKWHKWTDNVLNHPAVKETLQPREKLIGAYKRYAECTVRSEHYYTYFLRPENVPHWLRPAEKTTSTEPDWILNDKE